jgi:hypothetical protein
LFNGTTYPTESTSEVIDLLGWKRNRYITGMPYSVIGGSACFHFNVIKKVWFRGAVLCDKGESPQEYGISFQFSPNPIQGGYTGYLTVRPFNSDFKLYWGANLEMPLAEWYHTDSEHGASYTCVSTQKAHQSAPTVTELCGFGTTYWLTSTQPLGEDKLLYKCTTNFSVVQTFTAAPVMYIDADEEGCAGVRTDSGYRLTKIDNNGNYLLDVALGTTGYLGRYPICVACDGDFVWVGSSAFQEGSAEGPWASVRKFDMSGTVVARFSQDEKSTAKINAISVSTAGAWVCGTRVTPVT